MHVVQTCALRVWEADAGSLHISGINGRFRVVDQAGISPVHLTATATRTNGKASNTTGIVDANGGPEIQGQPQTAESSMAGACWRTNESRALIGFGPSCRNRITVGAPTRRQTAHGLRSIKAFAGRMPTVRKTISASCYNKRYSGYLPFQSDTGGKPIIWKDRDAG